MGIKSNAFKIILPNKKVIAEKVADDKERNSRSYWNAAKRRKPEMSTICRQLKLTASDGKKYRTDVVDEDGVNTLMALVPSKKSVVFKKWLTDMGTTIDEKSKQKAHIS